MKKIYFYYGKAKALEEINLNLEEKAFEAVIGPNGAGKSTLLRVISGLEEPDRGKIEFLGERIDEAKPHRIARKGIAHCPERRRLFFDMTVRENLDMGAYSLKNRAEEAFRLNKVMKISYIIVLLSVLPYILSLIFLFHPLWVYFAISQPILIVIGAIIFGIGMYIRNLHQQFRAREKARELRKLVYEIFPRLKERAKQRAGTLSGGEQQMLAIARALMSNPKLLLMDEPSLGLAPKVKETIFDAIDRIKKGGTTILLVEQDAVLAMHVSEYIHVLEEGKIEMRGTKEELEKEPRIKQVYLGI